MSKLGNLRTVDFSHLFSIVCPSEFFTTTMDLTDDLHAKPVHIQFYQLVKNVFSHPQLWPGHPLPASGLTIVHPIKCRLLVLSFKGPLQFSQPCFLSNQSVVFQPRNPSFSSLIRCPQSFILTLSPVSTLAQTTFHKRPLSQNVSKPQLVRLNDQWVLFVCFSF